MGGRTKAGLRVAAMAGLSLALAGAGWAQSRGIRVRVATASHRVSSSGISQTSFHPNFSSAPQVPGLGFDYVHLAAVGGGSRVVSSRGGHERFITPIFTGFGPYYSFLGDEPYAEPLYAQPQQQPSVIVIQQPPQTIVIQQPAPLADPGQPAASAAPAPAAPATPLPELTEFVFLRRDGKVVFAVAFTTAQGQLTYVTQEGIRRTFPLAELDREATLQMNEAKGTTLVLAE